MRCPTFCKRGANRLTGIIIWGIAEAGFVRECIRGSRMWWLSPDGWLPWGTWGTSPCNPLQPPAPLPLSLWGHSVTVTIDVTLWLSCGRYVTTLDMAPYQLVEYVVGTLRYTLTPSLTWALGVNLSKFWPSDTAYRYGLINSSPCVLSYHYKQRLGVDVSVHPCPLGLPAGGHS